MTFPKMFLDHLGWLHRWMLSYLMRNTRSEQINLRLLPFSFAQAGDIQQPDSALSRFGRTTTRMCCRSWLDIKMFLFTCQHLPWHVLAWYYGMLHATVLATMLHTTHIITTET